MMGNELQRFESEVRQNFRWNFLVSMLDLSLYSFGMGFVAAATVLPAFLRHLTSSSVIIGLLPSVGLWANTLPQIFIAKRMERLGVNKPLVVVFGFGERFYWLLLAVATLLLYNSPMLCLTAFFIIYATGNLSTGTATTPWWSMITKIMAQKRGFFYGVSSFVGGFLGVIGAMVSRQVLDYYTYPYSYVLCFLMAFTFTFISWIFLTLTREPAYPVHKEQSSLKDYFWRLPGVFRRDRNFTLFMLATILTSFSNMATAFYTVYAMDRIHLSDSDVALFTILLLGSRMAVSPILGYFGDRMGYKLFLELGVASAVFTTIIAALADSKLPFYLVFILMGFSISAEMVCQMSIVPDFCTPEERPIYLGLTSTLKAPFVAVTPILGGLIASRLSYPPVFLLTAVFVSSGLSLLHLVKEPHVKKHSVNSHASNPT